MAEVERIENAEGAVEIAAIGGKHDRVLRPPRGLVRVGVRAACFLARDVDQRLAVVQLERALRFVLDALRGNRYRGVTTHHRAVQRLIDRHVRDR